MNASLAMTADASVVFDAEVLGEKWVDETDTSATWTEIDPAVVSWATQTGQNTNWGIQ